jgi:hypothetical protein
MKEEIDYKELLIDLLDSLNELKNIDPMLNLKGEFSIETYLTTITSGRKLKKYMDSIIHFKEEDDYAFIRVKSNDTDEMVDVEKIHYKNVYFDFLRFFTFAQDNRNYDSSYKTNAGQVVEVVPIRKLLKEGYKK